MSEQNKTVVRRIIEEHWNNKNAELVSELFASNVSLDTPDGVLTGLEGASSLLQAYATAFPDFRLTIDDLFADGNKSSFDGRSPVRIVDRSRAQPPAEDR